MAAAAHTSSGLRPMVMMMMMMMMMLMLLMMMMPVACPSHWRSFLSFGLFHSSRMSPKFFYKTIS
eukprot:1662195-Amphidinium_carterae.1